MLRNPMSDNSAARARGYVDGYPLLRRCRRSATFVSSLLVGGWILGVSPGALAQLPGPPAANKVWGGCELTNGAVIELQNSLTAEGGLPGEPLPQVDFVIVYSLQNNNDGQAIGEAGFTGPILCTDPGMVSIDTTTADTPIPSATEQAAGVTVDIEGIEEALLLQYQKMQSGALLGDREKRVCHTVAGNTDCFLIKPAPD
ncbi:MAG: hypothetical protein ACREV4_11485 [Gammaproteobacteria bacterium]